MRKPYASDISREKFEEIVPMLQSVRKRTKPTTVSVLRGAVSAADWLPMEHVAQRHSEMEDGAFVFCEME